MRLENPQEYLALTVQHRRGNHQRHRRRDTERTNYGHTEASMYLFQQ